MRGQTGVLLEGQLIAFEGQVTVHRSSPVAIGFLRPGRLSVLAAWLAGRSLPLIRLVPPVVVLLPRVLIVVVFRCHTPRDCWRRAHIFLPVRRRTAATYSADSPQPASHSQSDAGVRQAMLDARKSENRKAVYGPVRDADIVVENLRPQLAAREGYAAVDLAEVRPGIIYARMKLNWWLTSSAA